MLTRVGRLNIICKVSEILFKGFQKLRKPVQMLFLALGYVNNSWQCLHFSVENASRSLNYMHSFQCKLERNSTACTQEIS